MQGILGTELIDYDLNPLQNDNDKAVRDALRAIYSRGNLGLNVVTATANITLDPRYAFILGDTTGGAFTITLPQANYWGAGKTPILIFQYIAGVANLTIAAAGADTINGAATIIMAGAGLRQTMLTDGVSKWYSN